MARSMQFAFILLAPLFVFAAMVWADRTFGQPGRGRDYTVRLQLPPAGGEIGLPQVQGPLDASRPLVVIDAGHGGYDPGAGSGSVKEKDLTLRLATALRDTLLAQGGVRVALTRDGDTFLALGERAGIARRLKADLFVSIHADSTEGSEASGATVYTLSSRGSSEVAERFAQRENRADSIYGVSIGEQSDAVSAILVDLSQRETQARSEEFARLIVREGARQIPFRPTPIESAAFAVLKSPDLPSVLIESGYINNPGDLDRLASPAGREAFAAAAAQAIRVYFARQAAI